MADRLDALRERLGPVWDAARRRSFWFVLPVATLAVVAVAVIVGRTAHLQADAWRIRANEIRATGETVAAWQSDLVRPTPAESASWRRSERLVQARAIAPADRIALMQEVAQRAENLGIGTVSVGFVSADTLDVTAFREVGSQVFEAAPYVLRVVLEAGYGSIASYLGGLPPQVDVHRLRVTGRDAALTAELLLVVYLDGSA